MVTFGDKNVVLMAGLFKGPSVEWPFLCESTVVTSLRNQQLNPVTNGNKHQEQYFFPKTYMHFTCFCLMLPHYICTLTVICKHMFYSMAYPRLFAELSDSTDAHECAHTHRGTHMQRHTHTQACTHTSIVIVNTQ